MLFKNLSVRLLSNNFKPFSIDGTIVVGAETGTGAYADTRKRGEVENYKKVSIWAKKKDWVPKWTLN